MNRLFGPHGWRNEVLRNEIVQDEGLPPAPGGDERLARYVSAPAVVRVAARTTHGEIVRDGMGVASQARMLDTRAKGPGTRGSDALQMAGLGAATSAFKHACYLIGRTFGGELGYRELAARGAQSGEPDAAPAATVKRAPFDRALHDRQPARALALSKWYSAGARCGEPARGRGGGAGSDGEAARSGCAARGRGASRCVAQGVGGEEAARRRCAGVRPRGGRRKGDGDGSRSQGEGARWPGIVSGIERAGDGLRR